MANALHDGEEIGHRKKSDAAFPKAAAGNHFPLQIAHRSPEKQSFSHPDFPSGAHQAFPIIRFCESLAGQENLDGPAQKTRARPDCQG